ncbi:MAG: S49 family peptidase [Wenzhouxiangella sp.]
MNKHSAIFWAGNDESFHTWLAALEASYKEARGFTRETPPPTEDTQSRLLQISDGVGVISVQGVLTNVDAWYNSLFGLIAYNEIIEAFHQAALDSAVKEILFDVGSPGGAVDGVMDAVEAVNDVKALKPVTAFTSSLAASAGYWLMSAAGKRYGTATAITGSIGVVAKHVEYSKMLEEAGVTQTVLRAGEFKQIVNSSEPLTDKAKAMIQGQIDYMYGIFVDSVATNLGVSSERVVSQMAEGREFIGQQGVDKGLIDGVSNFQDVFNAIATRIQQNGGNDMKKKYGMSAALAAASAGIKLDASAASEETPETTPATPETQEAGTDNPTLEVGTETPASAAGDEAPVTPEAEAEVEPGVVAMLQTQLKEKDTELLDLKLAAKDHERQVKGVQALKEIVVGAINNMNVALNRSKDETLIEKDVETLVSLHDAVLKQTVESFKIGGLAAHEAGEEPAPVMESRLDAKMREVTGIRKNNK